MILPMITRKKEDQNKSSKEWWGISKNRKFVNLNPTMSTMAVIHTSKNFVQQTKTLDSIK